jgi:hypothetical protein
VTSLTSVVAAAILVALAAPFGIFWCAVALLLTQLGVLGWMAAILRDAVASPVRSYVTGLVAPFLLMLAGAILGRLLVVHTVPGDGLARQCIILAGSTAGGATMGVSYFAVSFRGRLREYYAEMRDRAAVRA